MVYTGEEDRRDIIVRVIDREESGTEARFRPKGNSSEWTVCCDQHNTLAHLELFVVPILEARQPSLTQWSQTLNLEEQMSMLA